MRTHEYKALLCCCFCSDTEPQTVFSAAKSPNNTLGQQYGQLVYSVLLVVCEAVVANVNESLLATECTYTTPWYTIVASA